MPRTDLPKFAALLFLLVLLAFLPACNSAVISPQPASLNPALTSTQELPSSSPGNASAVPVATSLIPAGTSATQTLSAPDSTNSPAGTPRQHYILSASLDYARHQVSVDEQIDYPNRSGEALKDLLLLVEPSRFPDTFHLKEIRLGDSKPIEDYEREIGLLRLPLPQPLPPGEEIRISITYDLNLPSPDPAYYGRPVPFGYTDRQTNLVDWYPFIPPYVPGQGWLYHPAGAFGEYLVYEAADFEVNLRLEGQAQGVTIAASAPAETDGDWLRYRLDSARNFTLSASQMYQVLTAQVGQVTVLSYTFPFDAPAGQAALQTTAEALRLYAELFGPYPHQELSVVEADFLDGMEFDGLFFLSKGFYNTYSGNPGDYLVAIAAHETAHQWWYGLVGNDQALEPWLDEALSTYCERIYYERLHPEALSWWWDYRVRYYEPKGWVDGSIYNPEGYRPYRDAVYLNGALFLEDLRSLIGDEAFFKLLHTYAGRYSGEIATGKDFFSVLRQVSPADISNLLQKYFSNTIPADGSSPG